jgi:pyruvate formate lyase activating enzyme
MKEVSRRHFLYCSAGLFCSVLSADAFWPFSVKTGMAAGPADIRGHVYKGDAPRKLWKWSHEGFLYTKLDNQLVMCGICPNRCLLSPGDRGVCRSKVNMDGVLYSLTYGNPCSVNVDPIEKKPLFHFKPRSKTFSIATTGCNFRCLNCQNWEISQAKPHEVRHHELFPADVIQGAQRTGCTSIAYTYSEAVTFFEYMIDTARLAREEGVANLWISNGYINPKPLLEMCRVLDAANINLKAFSDAVYRKLNGGRLEPVLNTFKTLHEQGIHFEITNLVVPGYTDDAEMVKQMCQWILTTLGPDYPLHFLRFFPQYKLDRLPATPLSTLIRFRKLAMAEGIRYVYVGNVSYPEGNNTYCHHCKKLLVERIGYFIDAYDLNENRCKYCKTVIPGRWT